MSIDLREVFIRWGIGIDPQEISIDPQEISIDLQEVKHRSVRS
jgi:hypothetical protein